MSQSPSRLAASRDLRVDRDLSELRLLLRLRLRLRPRRPSRVLRSRRCELLQRLLRCWLLWRRPLRLRPWGLLRRDSRQDRSGSAVHCLLGAASPPVSLRRPLELAAAADSASHLAKHSRTATPQNCQFGGGLDKEASGSPVPSASTRRWKRFVAVSSVSMPSPPWRLHHARVSVSSTHRRRKASNCCKSPRGRALEGPSSCAWKNALARAAKSLDCTL
mmetsp:Transcript_62222/g.185343  ORF Transcript_62222/g.185343 Transcript_62222/m.185343 type:complete len:219 (+) Transcript_62222:314-970(+)